MLGYTILIKIAGLCETLLAKQKLTNLKEKHVCKDNTFVRHAPHNKATYQQSLRRGDGEKVNRGAGYTCRLEVPSV